MTFPANEREGPATSRAAYPGVRGRATYREGLFVGYRFYDRFHQKPLFPFGFGLSYTRFAFTDLRVRPKGGGRYAVSVRVRNVGRRAGGQVVQVYLGAPPEANEPPNQLKAFKKAWLAAGEARTVTLTLDRSSFATWSASRHAWVVLRGTYRVRVGTSSRSLPLQHRVRM